MYSPCTHNNLSAISSTATLQSLVFPKRVSHKLKLNNGDLKATQGDTGHAEIDMITKVYAHILDEDRKINAQKFETAFYSNPDLRDVHAPASPAASFDLGLLFAELKRSPELAGTLANLIGVSAGAVTK